MDRNSAIGFTLIAALLVIYFYFFSPTPQPPNPKKDVPQTAGNTVPDTVKSSAVPMTDSVLAQTYGGLAQAMKGEEANHTVETEDLKITFSNRGGIIKELELKKYQTYHKKPLKLISPRDNEFRLLTRYNDKDLDLYQLFYNFEQTTKGDTTIVSFSAPTANGSSITQTYYIPKNGYEIKYGISGGNFENNFAGDALSFEWNRSIRQT